MCIYVLYSGVRSLEDGTDTRLGLHILQGIHYYCSHFIFLLSKYSDEISMQLIVIIYLFYI